MTTLITGLGQVGAHVAQLLVREGGKPVAFDVNPPLAFVETVVPTDRMAIRRGDVRDLAALIEVVRQEQVDLIVHTAALLPPRSEEDVRLTTEVNVQGTLNVLEAARLMGVRRVVFCSTIGVYDMRVIRDERVREDGPLGPEIVYSASKVYCEKIGESYARRHGVEFVALRFAHVFGPGPLPVRPGLGMLVWEIADACMRGGRHVIQPRAAVAREYVYVVDVARAVVLALKAQSPRDIAFNVGMGRVHAPQEMAEVAGRITPGLQIEMARTDSADGQRYAVAGRPFDMTRAREQLGYAPEYDLETALRHYVAYLRSVAG